MRTSVTDQIGRFIEFWATFQNILATTILPNLPTFYGNFCKGVNIFHFSSEIIFGQLSINIWQLLSGHTDWRTWKGEEMINLTIVCTRTSDISIHDIWVVAECFWKLDVCLYLLFISIFFSFQ